MPSAFDVLENDHEQVKQLLSKFEMAPAASGTHDSLLGARKKMAEAQRRRDGGWSPSGWPPEFGCW